MLFIGKVFELQWAKETLPKSTKFNEVVTLYLKALGLKHVLWIINIFNIFVQGKVILNKRVETIVKAVMECGYCVLRYLLLDSMQITEVSLRTFITFI